MNKCKVQSVKCKVISQKLKLLTFTLLLYTLTFTLYASPAYAACDPKIPGDCPAGLDQIEQVFTGFISAAVFLAFVASLVMLIITGIKYLTSGGEPKAVQAAHQTATWALMGILFFAIAWLLLQLIQGFTGIPVTVFDIKALCVGPASALEFCPK